MEGGWNLHLGSIIHSLSELKWTPLFTKFSEVSCSKTCAEQGWCMSFLSLQWDIITSFKASSFTVLEIRSQKSAGSPRGVIRENPLLASCIFQLPVASLVFPGCGHTTLTSASLFMSRFPLCVCLCGTVKRVFPVAEIHQTMQGGQLTSWAFIESFCRLFSQVRKHSQVLWDLDVRISL